MTRVYAMNEPALWRAAGGWAAAYAVTVVSRTAFDWFLPTDAFQVRSTVSTYTAIALFLAAGFWTAWRTNSVRSGVLVGMAMSALSAAMILVSSVVMLGIWHDPQTLQAIAQSGGMGEVFTLPLLVSVPAVILAAIGAVAKKHSPSLLRS